MTKYVLLSFQTQESQLDFIFLILKLEVYVDSPPFLHTVATLLVIAEIRLSVFFFFVSSIKPYEWGIPGAFT